MKPAYKLMTGLLTVVVLTMTAITAHAQAIQPGVVMRYYESKEKQPLPGVQLEIVKAGTHISGPDGTFTLKFNSLKPGDRVIVSKIIKPGFELFNKTDISNWIISRNRVPFTIILVNSADFNRQKNETRQLVTNNYKARYEEKVRELERLRRANKLQEKEFLSREKELKRQMEEFKSNIDAYIDNFVRIDLSEISAEELKILKLFKDGHAQEAYDAYKNLHLVEKLDHEIDSYISITKRMRDDFKNLCDAVLRKADTFVLMDKMDDAREELEALLEKLKPLVEMHPDAFIPQIATIRFRLGDLAIKDILTDDEEATEHLIIAKDLYLKLNEEFPGMYRADLAMTQERLGQVYVKSDSLEAAEQLYLHALENWKQILAGDPDNMDDLGNMARVKQRLGALYTDR